MFLSSRQNMQNSAEAIYTFRSFHGAAIYRSGFSYTYIKAKLRPRLRQSYIPLVTSNISYNVLWIYRMLTSDFLFYLWCAHWVGFAGNIICLVLRIELQLPEVVLSEWHLQTIPMKLIGRSEAIALMQSLAWGQLLFSSITSVRSFISLILKVYFGIFRSYLFKV